MSKIRFTAAISAAIMLTIGLAGCSYNDMSTALSTPDSVVQLTEDGAFTDPTFGYVNREQDVIPFTECEMAFWTMVKNYCVNADSSKKFEWSVDENGYITGAKMTSDGIPTDLKCTLDKDDTWSGLNICVPVGGKK